MLTLPRVLYNVNIEYLYRRNVVYPKNQLMDNTKSNEYVLKERIIVSRHPTLWCLDFEELKKKSLRDEIKNISGENYIVIHGNMIVQRLDWQEITDPMVIAKLYGEE